MVAVGKKSQLCWDLEYILPINKNSYGFIFNTNLG